MKRVILATLSTVVGMVALLGFKSHSLAGSTPSAGAAPAKGSASSGSGTTVTGNSVSTVWGPVQVAVVKEGGKITKVTLVKVPDNNDRDKLINQTAVPQLVQETLAAQSAKIDAVSGATFTSQGYITSLQSALDKA